MPQNQLDRVIKTLNLNAKIKIAAANDRLEETEMDSFFGISDEDWWNRQELRRDHDKFEAGWSVDEFCKSARAAKHASIRIMVILICFAANVAHRIFMTGSPTCALLPQFKHSLLVLILQLMLDGTCLYQLHSTNCFLLPSKVSLTF